MQLWRPNETKQPGQLERPFFHFYDLAHGFAEQLLFAFFALALAWSLAQLVPSSTPAVLGLIAVASMPCWAYARIALYARQGRLEAQRWRSDAARRRHQFEESWHYLVRVLVAWASAQFVASALAPVGYELAIVLPTLIYVIQSRPYHDMHVVMHARDHILGAGEDRFASREHSRPDAGTESNDERG